MLYTKSANVRSALRLNVALSALACSLGLTAIPGIAQAQVATTPASSPDESDEATTDIIVTGTLLRGVPPVGSHQISVGQKQVESQGVTTSNELLATIPQVTNLFNNVPVSRLNVAANQIQVVRPNLRNLSPETGSTASTLVLVDGHRIGGVGVTQSAVDPDIIPVGAIERVEVVTDGGSATYGADAVGGVINFITRKRFNGVQAGGHYGIADNYYTADANATVGKDWGSGSLFASYNYQSNDAIFGRDRGYIRQVDFTAAARTPIGRQCTPGNVTLPGAFSFVTFTFGPSTTYGLPNLTTPGFNACDLTDDTSFIPDSRRHSGLVGLHQDLSSHVSVDLRAFYGERTTTSYAPLRGDVTVTSGNAYYRPIASNPTAAQTVSFTFSPVLGSAAGTSGTRSVEWGTSADFKVDLGHNFQLHQLLNYTHSDSSYYINALNQTLLAAAGAGTTAATAVNFYDPTATTNTALIRAIANSEFAGQGIDDLVNARTIVDGSLFTLPGGDVKIAAGYEFLRDEFKQRIAPPDAIRGTVNSLAYTPYNRTVHSLFAEAQLPVIGEGNRSPGLYSLVFSGSVRYDHFSDFGGTTNPKFGVAFMPVSWLNLRGNYSTSFNAPGAVDQLGSQRNTISFFPFNAFVRPGDTPVAVGTVALQGSTPNLIPQTAKTYSFGADLNGSLIPGLTANVSYYHVDFDNILTIPTPNAGIFTDFPNNVVSNVNGLTAAQLRSFESLAPNGASVIEPLITGNRPVYEVVNFLTGNYGKLKVSGIDFAANYRYTTGFGGVDASVAGNYQLTRTQQVGPGAAVSDLLAYDTSPLQLQGTLGADYGALRAQATVNHSSGFAVRRSATLPQDRVGSYDTVNLFLKYTIKSETRGLNGLSLTLNVNNAFDQDPPLYQLSTGNGFINGFTIGRLFLFGVSTKF